MPPPPRAAVRANNAQKTAAAVKDGTPQSLVAVLRTGTRAARKEAAQDISRGALTDSLYSEAIAAAGAIPLLISLLPISQSAKLDDCSLAASAALKALSYHEPNRSKIADNGGVSALLFAFSQGSSDAALALWNLSSEDKCCQAIVESGGIPELITSVLYLEMGEAAAGTIANLATNATYSHLIGEAGGIQSLLSILECGSAGVKLQAVLALGTLAPHGRNNCLIMEGNGIHLLLDRLENGRSHEVETAAGAIMNLAHQNELMKVAMVNECGVKPLIDILSSGSPLAQEHAVGALLNLCEGDDEDIKQAIWDAGVQPPLSRLRGSTFSES